MILDSSAVISYMRRETRYERLEASMERAGFLAIGAPTLLETGMVAMRVFGHEGLQLVFHFLEGWEVEVLPFDQQHWEEGMDAFLRFGKGRHPARLNLGDCMTYASARVAGEPLLFTGNDFARTDIAPA
jgi:ribonuclease VapC